EYANERTRADIRALGSRDRPDCLAVTGDIWCGDGIPSAAPMWMARALAFLASLETPWAFTWGNHDYAADFAEARAKIAATPLYAAPKCTDRGESHIQVVNAQGDA